MAVNYSVCIISQVWKDFKRPSTVTENVCNDSSATSTAHKCPQAHCRTCHYPKKEPWTRTLKWKLLLHRKPWSEDDILFYCCDRVYAAICHDWWKSITAMPQLPSKRAKISTLTDYVSCMCNWDRSIRKPHVESAVTVTYRSLMTQRLLFPRTSSMR